MQKRDWVEEKVVFAGARNKSGGEDILSKPPQHPKTVLVYVLPCRHTLAVDHP